MHDPHVANPFYRHSDTWPRKGRRMVEAVAAAFKAAFLAASQRANNSPSATERALADLSQANETIRMQQLPEPDFQSRPNASTLPATRICL